MSKQESPDPSQAVSNTTGAQPGRPRVGKKERRSFAISLHLTEGEFNAIVKHAKANANAALAPHARKLVLARIQADGRFEEMGKAFVELKKEIKESHSKLDPMANKLGSHANAISMIGGRMDRLENLFYDKLNKVESNSRITNSAISSLQKSIECLIALQSGVVPHESSRGPLGHDEAVGKNLSGNSGNAPDGAVQSVGRAMDDIDIDIFEELFGPDEPQD